MSKKLITVELSPFTIQEARDMAAIAHAATLESRIPFLPYFDGFRTSHEVSRIEERHGPSYLRTLRTELEALMLANGTPSQKCAAT